MAHSGPDAGYARGRSGAVEPRRLARVCRVLGRSLAGIGLPGAALLVALGPGLSDPVAAGRWAASAMDTVLVTPGGLPWAFHAAMLSALFGTWLFGLALIVEGYFGIEWR